MIIEESGFHEHLLAALLRLRLHTAVCWDQIMSLVATVWCPICLNAAARLRPDHLHSPISSEMPANLSLCSLLPCASKIHVCLQCTVKTAWHQIGSEAMLMTLFAVLIMELGSCPQHNHQITSNL